MRTAHSLTVSWGLSTQGGGGSPRGFLPGGVSAQEGLPGECLLRGVGVSAIWPIP